MNRSKGRRSSIPPAGPEIDRVEVWQLPNMLAALPCVDKRLEFFRDKPGSDRWKGHKGAQQRALSGDPDRLAKAMSRSDELIADAIAHDPRLGRRGTWERSEEGEFACPALIAAGDDAPCFRRVRKNFTDRPGYEDEGIRVVISTDCNEIKPDTAAAFIATARLVQQFRPLQIWWQGGWLSENQYRGFVFHVPLIQGDMDFSRLEFCIADAWRDSLSFDVMAARGIEIGRCWNTCGHQSQHCYLSGNTHFIDHDGITPDGEAVAGYAGRWLGWESVWSMRYASERDSKAALQMLPPIPTPPRERTKEEIENDRKWSEKWREQQQVENRKKAEARQKGVL